MGSAGSYELPRIDLIKTKEERDFIVTIRIVDITEVGENIRIRFEKRFSILIVSCIVLAILFRLDMIFDVYGHCLGFGRQVIFKLILFKEMDFGCNIVGEKDTVYLYV